MREMTAIKKSMITAICMALCVVLPLAFHGIPKAGAIWGPMHIPILLCGLICGWEYGLLCGLLGPVLSSMLTGMPDMGRLPAMVFEGATYGLLTGLLMKLIRTRRITLDIYISLIVAMISGRIVAGIVKALIFARGEMSVTIWATGSFVTSLPGIAIQLILIPVMVIALMNAGLIPRKYADKKS